MHKGKVHYSKFYLIRQNIAFVSAFSTNLLFLVKPVFQDFRDNGHSVLYLVFIHKLLVVLFLVGFPGFWGFFPFHFHQALACNTYMN